MAAAAWAFGGVVRAFECAPHGFCVGIGGIGVVWLLWGVVWVLNGC